MARLRSAGSTIDSSQPSSVSCGLYHVALRRLTDHLRSELARRRREDAVE